MGNFERAWRNRHKREKNWKSSIALGHIVFWNVLMFLKIVTKWREIKRSKLSNSVWPIERSKKIFHVLFYRLRLVKKCLFSSSWLRRYLVIVLRSTIGIVHHVHHALSVGQVTEWKLSVRTNKTRSVWNVILGTIIQTPQTWNHVNCKFRLAVRSNLFNTDTKGTQRCPYYRGTEGTDQ